MARVELPIFLPHIDYVWVRDGRCNGAPVAAGDIVDRSVLDTRKMQALFDMRRIKPAGFQGPAPAYLNNGRGKTAQLAKQIAAEEANAGADIANAKPEPKPAPASRPNAKTSPAPVKPAPAKSVAPATAPKRGRGRAAA